MSELCEQQIATQLVLPSPMAEPYLYLDEDGPEMIDARRREAAYFRKFHMDALAEAVEREDQD